MSSHWDAFTKALKEAFVDIDRKYFKIARYDDEDRHLERVYCYELYYQLRVRLSRLTSFPYVLHGEVDKYGHDYVETALGAGLKPDFIVHDPGCMDQHSNLAVIEVKTFYQRQQGKTAIEHLRKFLDKVKYGYGVLLVFGDEVGKDLSEDLKTIDKGITILWHRKAGELPIQWAGPKLWAAAGP